MSDISNISNNYAISFELVIKNSVIDLSSNINSIKIIHSIEDIQPIFLINMNTRILQNFNSNYKYAKLTINSNLINTSSINQNTYFLLPYSLATKTYSTNMKNDDMFDNSTVNLTFISKNCYNCLNASINTYISHNTNITNVLNDIKPNNTNLLLSKNININNIDQICIPKQSYLGALKHILHLFSLYPGATIFTSFPDSSNESLNTNIYIKDINKEMKSNNYDFTVIQVLAGQNDYHNDISQQFTKSNKPTIVTNQNIIYNSNSAANMTTNNYNVLVKPLDQLYNVHNYTKNELINNYGIVDGNMDSNEDNYSELLNDTHQIVNKHSGGYNNSFDWFTSNITKELANMNSILISVNQKQYLGQLWAGQIFNLDISDVEAVKFSGKFLLSKIEYILNCNNPLSYNMYINLIGVRSNLFVRNNN